MANDKKYHICGFDQKTKNEGLLSLLKQGCRNSKNMDFVERDYRIWKTSIYCLWLIIKNIVYDKLNKKPKHER